MNPELTCSESAFIISILSSPPPASPTSTPADALPLATVACRASPGGTWPLNTTSPNEHAFESGSITSSLVATDASTPSFSLCSACCETPTADAWSRMFSDVHKPAMAAPILSGSVSLETRGMSKRTVMVCVSRWSS